MQSSIYFKNINKKMTDQIMIGPKRYPSYASAQWVSREFAYFVISLEITSF